MDMQLTGNYPIIIDGNETGRMDVSREGLFWCFEATSDMTDGIIRLSVFGDDGEGYLGVMEPKGKRLSLTKKLSRSGLRGFPRTISYGGKQGEAQSYSADAASLEVTEAQTRGAASGDANTASDAESGCSCNSSESGDPEQRPQYGRPPPKKNMTRAKPLVWKMCGCPASYLSSIEGKNIFGSRKNVLEASDGEYVFLALPEKTSRIYPEQQRLFAGKTVVMGESYLVCKIKNGKII